MAKCPFRLRAPVVIPWPPDNSLLITDYGASTSASAAANRSAIQNCMNACAAAGKIMAIPDGTYHVEPYITWRKGVTIQGQHRETAVLDAVGSGKLIYAWEGDGGGSVYDLTFTAQHTPGSDYPSDCIAGHGLVGGEIKRVTISGYHYGIALGSGVMCSGLRIDDVVIEDCYEPIYLCCVEDSMFANIRATALYAPAVCLAETGSDQQWHTMYICDGVRRCTFTGLHLIGGTGYALQFWTEEIRTYGDGEIGNLTFTGLTVDATDGRHPMVMGHASDSFPVHDINITDLVLRAGSVGAYNQLIQWYGGTRVVIDGITASGGSSLHAGSGPAMSASEVKHGTYTGSYGGAIIGAVPGVTVTDVDLV